ncbi:unnamed protein product [Linum trigynum]|uniref:DUF4216 domain-containing protein n=2 Tax=Linum trigynum TaxID=586398 RepID=A0AAV2DBS2_9ROSI
MDGHLTSMNMDRKWCTEDPYVLASQANQVFYIADIKNGGAWHIVHKVCPRSLYDVPEKEEAGHGDPVYENQPYQQDVDISDFNVSESDLADLSRDDEASTIITEPVIRANDRRAGAVVASDEEIEDDTLDDHHFTTNETEHPDGNDPSFSDEEEA